MKGNVNMDYITKIIGPMLEGAQTTVLLFFICIISSIPLGFLITLMANSKVKPVSWFAHSFIYVMRGTPLLLQMLFFCYGLPALPVVGEYLILDRFVAAGLAFALNYAAYFAEIFRGGLLAVDGGQYEAAKVLGLSKFQTMTRVIIPQMFRVVIPSVSNESITLIKDTALLYAVSVPDLLHFALTAVNRDVSITPFFIAAVIYLLMTLVLTILFKWLEKKFKFQ
jgi:polar amino acid transport system permease protein